MTHRHRKLINGQYQPIHPFGECEFCDEFWDRLAWLQNYSTPQGEGDILYAYEINQPEHPRWGLEPSAEEDNDNAESEESPVVPD